MSFFTRLFGRDRQPEPPRDLRNMNEDWQVGDLAECLSGLWDYPFGPVKGGIYRVACVVKGPLASGPDKGAIVYGLVLKEFGTESWLCTGFRKIRPLHEPCEAEFAELIRRPVRKRETA